MEISGKNFGKGPYKKGHIPRKNGASKLGEAVENAKDNYELYDKLVEQFGNGENAVKEINKMVNGSVHGRAYPDSSVVEMAVPGNRNRTVRTATSKDNGGVKIDTLNRPVFGF
jgi:hypothetical protein